MKALIAVVMFLFAQVLVAQEQRNVLGVIVFRDCGTVVAIQTLYTRGSEFKATVIVPTLVNQPMWKDALRLIINYVAAGGATKVVELKDQCTRI